MDTGSEILEPTGSTRVQWIVAIVAQVSLVTHGMQFGWLSPVAQILQSPESPLNRPLTDTELTLIASLPSVSAIVGIFILVYIVDHYGRKCAIIVISGFQLICWILTIWPGTFISILIGRWFCGLAAGGCYHIVPMYIKEISQNNIRGTLGSILSLYQNIGMLAMYIMGGYLEYHIVLYIVIGLPAVAILVFFKLPESPAYLLKIGKEEHAAANIAYLRTLNVTNKVVQDEINSIKREDEFFKSLPDVTFNTILKVKPWRRGFLILLFVFIVRSLNGAFALFHYASIILVTSEVNISPELQSLGIPGFMAIGTVITMVAIDHLGRKMLLAFNFGLSGLTFLGFASAIILREHGWYTPGWLPLAALFVAACCYGSGISPVPIVIMSEMFNFQIRAKLMACLSIVSWVLFFAQLIMFTAITNAYGIHMTFFVFGIMNVIGTVLTLLLPETKNKSVEEIEEELSRTKKEEKCIKC